MKRVILSLLILSVCGCASIPLSTMLNFSHFDEQDFYALQPAQIRTRVSLSEPFTIDLANTELSLKLESEKGARYFHFPLTLVNESKRPATQSFFFSEQAKNEYVFKLSDKGITNFKEVQQSFSQNQNASGSFSVSTGFNEDVNVYQSATVSIALQLNEVDGFFLLIENAEVEFNHGG